MMMELIPMELEAANEFVTRLHRHHPPVRGHKFSIGAVKDGALVGVAIIGRPVARMSDDGDTLEVTRLCTDGTKNACSFLYGASARATFALGYRTIGTFTMPDEGGASLRAAGWKLIGRRKAREWKHTSGPRNNAHVIAPRLFWELERSHG